MTAPETGRSPRLLTLTTDFGLTDHYVGTMKGVVAAQAPGIEMVDITHGVPAFDIAEGAFAIAQAYPFFPEGTVHVVVVDPGVGTARRPIAVRACGHLFVAPDNGVLSQVIEDALDHEARQIRVRHGLPSLSDTFHGRDLFAPAGARLAAGLPFGEVGPRVRDLRLLPPARPSEGVARVLHVDTYGNVVTGFRPGDLRAGDCLRLSGVAVCERASSYASVKDGRPFLVTGSSGFLEVSVNRASAARTLGVRAGDSVTIARVGRSADAAGISRPARSCIRSGCRAGSGTD